MVGVGDALINVLGMVDAHGPLAEGRRPEPSGLGSPAVPDSTYGLPGAIVDDKERFIGLLKWLHQAGNGNYTAVIDGLMKQAATAAE